ncbi:TauD/TfdA family dioxygenase [Pelagibius sp. Alg239-R121]|uniref:TauD/TfdA dioxygenase family protein n=1 Tax=Pelagibius sp. Alg239-R121 TaxID=2993448 RepID=UPI0024A68386|nr:TauD/TfdA family dioxygenase [Pelagibius sp. Alg239-R121]
MPIETFKVRPITPVLGAEVHGVDLSKPLSGCRSDELRGMLMDYQVIFFRDQNVSLEQLKRFGRLFGELEVHPYASSQNGHPEVLPIHADAKSKQVAGERWHSDVSCDAEPPMGSILHLHTVPEVGGDTLFSSMYAAYDALSEKMKQYLDGLIAVHDGGPNYRRRAAIEGLDDKRDFPRAEHPVVRTHPVTGRKAIFVNPVFTTAIRGLPENEGDATLQFLYNHNSQPQFQLRFRWQENSIAFWDNRCVQHIAMWDYYPQVRSGNRVTVKGDKPY